MQPVTERSRLFIDGEFVKPSSKRLIAVISPTTEEPVGHAVDADGTDVDRAVSRHGAVSTPACGGTFRSGSALRFLIERSDCSKPVRRRSVT